MKIIYILSAVVLLSFSACNKCYECDFSTPNNPDVREICSNNFKGDKVTFQKTIDEYIAAGYKCTAK